MHWTPEHAQPLNQWPEQHLDVSSTTPSPAHKLELPPGGRQRCHYAWAHDDISALTASNLLKRYAEKYSGVLDSPYERPALGGYGDAAFLNGAKGDPEPWPGPEPPYPLASLHEGLPGTKAGSGGGSGGLGGSPSGLSLKRKAADEGAEGRYRKYVYEPTKAPAADGASYPAADNGECRGNGFRAKPPGAAEEASGKYGGGVPLKVLGSPVYGPPLEPFEKFPERAPAPATRGGFALPSGEPPKGVDPGALELATGKLLECGPPVQWADVAGQGALKAALEEELVWPLLRPPAYPGSPRPPRTLLLFGLCPLATLMEGADGVLVVGTTSRPAALDEATRRRFALRFYVALPDGAARGQILQRALAQQGCALSERELAALVQGTQGFSGGELGQLCQQAAAGAGLPGLQRPLSYKDLEAALAKVGPRASPKDLDSFVEWDKMYGSGH
ncbi:PREDICTED: putative fidgetin-like protein 2 [Ceratotherium simum simum]|uniref:Fidgetin-like protein 2 n=1 Tax=Ceratotherium simum simum TaxID=73337 RepID=A0ABM1CRP6_CERSS|nr:PREDICTED: putative fidgetin-like protein 2 [Ceratotherium simum simum]